MIWKSTRERKPDIKFGMSDTFKGGDRNWRETSANHLFGKWKWKLPWEMTTATMIFVVGKLDGRGRG
jgi:hypothetical protein